MAIHSRELKALTIRDWHTRWTSKLIHHELATIEGIRYSITSDWLALVILELFCWSLTNSPLRVQAMLKCIALRLRSFFLR